MVGVEVVRDGFWMYFKGRVEVFVVGWDVGYKRKREIKDWKVFDLRN